MTLRSVTIAGVSDEQMNSQAIYSLELAGDFLLHSFLSHHHIRKRIKRVLVLFPLGR